METPLAYKLMQKKASLLDSVFLSDCHKGHCLFNDYLGLVELPIQDPAVPMSDTVVQGSVKSGHTV